MITIRRTKFYKSRLVPFGTHLGQALRYAATRPGPVAQSPRGDVPFFTTRTGTRVKKYTIHRDFHACGSTPASAARTVDAVSRCLHDFCVTPLPVTG